MGGRSGEKRARNRKSNAYTDVETWKEERNGIKIIRMKVIYKKKKRRKKK